MTRSLRHSEWNRLPASSATTQPIVDSTRMSFSGLEMFGTCTGALPCRVRSCNARGMTPPLSIFPALHSVPLVVRSLVFVGVLFAMFHS
ncbi:hypothetical protein Y032_0306g1986 [Ancylostoma ceylanicum]|uniref:Uncharacterized protein n=1 Tax=Ancylostoma ceylanicum TaxID=53326 RepID=A0A016S2W1_9BILA|nr:hypothetical protein Y032_0306g1986 [Ancylostoma ceylanicum]